MRILIAGASAPLLAAVIASPALAQSQEDVSATLRRLEAQIAAQAEQLAAQQEEIAQLRKIADDTLEAQRGAGAAPPPLILPSISPDGVVAANAVVMLTDTPQQVAPVGEAPPQSERVEVAALPESAGVLTPRGSFVLEQALDYSHGSSNRLVFRGVEIVTGIQIGVIEASDADRSTLAGAWSLRYGLTNRLEVEARVPYLYRADRITTLVQRETAATRTMELQGKDIGDVEVAARYQVNAGRNGWPIAIAGLRVKSPTGVGPFDVDRDEFGVATELGTGSGFWAIEPSVNLIYPTDPAVLYASLSYLVNVPRDIDQVIGGVPVGEVDPGDSLGFSAGFGFALNQRFSFSLGYKHNYIWKTQTEIAGTTQEGDSLQVGAFTFGWSMRLSDRVTFANTYEVGTTSDSPDMRVVFRVPVRF